MKRPGVIVSKKLVIVNSLSSLIAKVLNATVLIWLYQFLVKRVDASEYSLLPVIMSVMAFAPLLTTVLTGGIGRFVLEAHAQADDRRVRQIVSSMFPLLLATGLLVLVAGGFLAWNISDVLNIAPNRLGEARCMLGLMLFMLAVRLPCAAFDVGPYVHQKFIWLNSIELGTQLLRVIFLLLLLNGLGARVIWVVLANSAADLISLIVLQVISCRMMPALRFSRTHVEWAVARQLLSFGGWNFVSQLGATIRESSDMIILNRLATPLDVTAFHLGSIPDRNIRHTILAVTDPLMPALTALHAIDARERVRNAYLKVGKYSMFAALAVAVPLIIYRTELYSLYLGARYPTYAAAATVMALLLASYPVFYTNTMTFKVAYACGRMRGVAIVTLLSQFLNIAITIYFVRALQLGAVGSALGTFVIDCATVSFAYLPLGFRLADLTVVRWMKELVLPGLVPSIVGGAVWWILKMIVAPGHWISLGLCGAAGLLGYAGAITAFCLDPQERGYLKSARKRMFDLFAPDRQRLNAGAPEAEVPIRSREF